MDSCHSAEATTASQRLCEYWREGRCTQGRRCRFLHTEGLGHQTVPRARRRHRGRGGGGGGAGDGEASSEEGSESPPSAPHAAADIRRQPADADAVAKGAQPLLVATSAATDGGADGCAVTEQHRRPAPPTWQTVLRMQVAIDHWLRVLSCEASTAEVVHVRNRLRQLSLSIAVVLRGAAPEVYED